MRRESLLTRRDWGCRKTKKRKGNQTLSHTPPHLFPKLPIRLLYPLAPGGVIQRAELSKHDPELLRQNLARIWVLPFHPAKGETFNLKLLWDRGHFFHGLGDHLIPQTSTLGAGQLALPDYIVNSKRY